MLQVVIETLVVITLVERANLTLIGKQQESSELADPQAPCLCKEKELQMAVLTSWLEYTNSDNKTYFRAPT